MHRKRILITVIVAMLVSVTAITGVVAASSDDAATRKWICGAYKSLPGKMERC